MTYVLLFPPSCKFRRKRNLTKSFGNSTKLQKL